MAGSAQWGARLVALLASFAGLATAAAVLPSAARDGAVADIGRRLASRERFAAPDLARMDRPDSAARAARRCDLPVLRGLGEGGRGGGAAGGDERDGEEQVDPAHDRSR